MAKSSPAMGGNTSAIDFATLGGHVKHQGALNTKRKHKHANMSRLAHSGSSGDSDSSAPDGVAADDSEGDQSDGADADDEEGNDGDPDVRAPSDMNFAPDEGQAGLYQNSKSRPGIANKKFAEQVSESNSDECLNGSHDAVASTPVLKEEVVSDDDDYNGVDLISESGDDEPVVEHLEEKAIIDSEEDNVGHSLPLSPPNSPSDAFSISSAGLGNTELGISPWLTEDPFFAEQINLLDQDDFRYDPDHYGHANGLGSPTGVEDTPRRRVRFAEPIMLASEAETAGSTKLNDGGSLSSHISIDRSNSHPAEADQSSLDGTSVTAGESVHLTSREDNAASSEDYDPVNNADAESSVGSSSGYESGLLLSCNKQVPHADLFARS